MVEIRTVCVRSIDTFADNRTVGLAGGGLLVLAGLGFGYLPVRYLLAYGPNLGASAAVDLVIAVSILLAGVGILLLVSDADVDLSPHAAIPLGLVGAVFSVFPLFGALAGGGVAPAALAGVVGGILSVMWRPGPADSVGPARS